MISLIVVNFRAAALAAECIESARRATRDALQVIVVDNSVDPDEAERLRRHADCLETPATNLGYAGAINIGRRHASADVLIVTNPDVVFGAASIDLLAAALVGPIGVAGPALFWDDEYRWLLPPADVMTTPQKLDQVIAARWRRWAAWRDRRRIRNRIRFWQAIATQHVPAVSGAVMAIRARDFDRVGGFDERFPLYFEEIDFMRRLKKSGGRVAFVASARCRHLYNQSAGSASDAAAALYAQSERAYLRKWSSGLLQFLKSLERAPRVGQFRELGEHETIEIDFDDALVEASPLPSFETAAGHFPPRGRLELPPEVVSTYRQDALYLRVIDSSTLSVKAAYVRRSPVAG